MRRSTARPSNARIGAALLDLLGAANQLAARKRALEALELDEACVRSGDRVLDPRRLAEALRVAGLDTRRARQLGERCAASGDGALRARFAGIASSERAYRQCDRLLPREHPDGRYEVCALDSGEALVAYAAGPGAPVDALLCAVRAGLLSALPETFGAAPAWVEESECVTRGDPRCLYRVRFARAAGGWSGAAAGAALGLVAAALGMLPAPLAAGSLALLGGFAGALVGRRGSGGQRTAVAGSSDAQLEQLERELAGRMDELAKLDSLFDAGAGRAAAGVRAGGLGRDDQRVAAHVRDLRHELRRAQRALATLAGGDCERTGEDGRADSAAHETAREAGWEEIEVRLGRMAILADALEDEVGPGPARRTPEDLGELVRQVLGRIGRDRAREVRVEIEIDPGSPRVACDAFEIECATEQLVRNAFDAAPAGGTVRVSVRSVPEGVEVAIRDDGDGIEPAHVDAAFDPFEGRTATGRAGSAGAAIRFGLPVCARIVAEHGGELRIQAEPSVGTRASFVLPPAGGASSSE